MKNLLFTLALLPMVAFAQVDGKACVSCKRMDSLVATGDLIPAVRYLSEFRFSKNKALIPAEAESVTRMAVKFLPLDVEQDTAAFYYDLYQQQPVAMKAALEATAPETQALLKEYLAGADCSNRSGNGGSDCAKTKGK